MAHIVRFGSYEADLDSGQLRKRGIRIKLRAQSFLILARLMEQPGELVTRSELQRLLWNDDVSVDFENNLNTAVAHLRAIVREFGYEVEPVPVRGCLHLKSAVTQVAPDTLLVNPSWLPDGAFREFARIEVDEAEPLGANGLLIRDTLIYPTAFPRTSDRLKARGIKMSAVDVSELAKAEGAVTCCSLVVTVVGGESQTSSGRQ
jgi:DNA-binding winged helix-turn-helix (wHTH) protein